MIFKFIKYSLWVIIMLAVISKAFGLSKLQEDTPLMPRQIDLSGNILHFSIPENFSKDMPADDLIERINLADEEIYKDHNKFTLIRRWWDISDNGFLSKNTGTIMMSIYVKKTPENSDKNILEPLGLIGTIIDGFNKSNDNKNPDISYPNFYEAYSIYEVNKQNWISYSVENTTNHQHDINYAIPITTNNYVVISFSFSPNNNYSIREFIENNGRKHMNKIMHSFEIIYTPKSQLPSVISQPINLQKLIEDKLY